MFKKIVLLVALMLFAIPSVCFSAGTVTQTYHDIYSADYNAVVSVVKFVCTGDSSDGSIPNTALNADITSRVQGKYLYTVSAYPTSGGTAPDAADIFILDANGEDLLGSTDGGTTANKGANLIHATLKKTTIPYSHYLSAAYFPAVVNTLTLKVASQATASAQYVIELVFVR